MAGAGVIDILGGVEAEAIDSFADPVFADVLYFFPNRSYVIVEFREAIAEEIDASVPIGMGSMPGVAIRRMVEDAVH